MTVVEKKSIFILTGICISFLIVLLLLTNTKGYTSARDIVSIDKMVDRRSLKYRSLGNAIYAGRLHHLQHICMNSSDGYRGGSSDEDVMHNIHIDTSNNLVYCQIQKVGSTFIRNLLSKLSEKSTKGKSSLQRLSKQDLGFAELHFALHNSDKFMFVREPYSRVLSGYVDKLFSPNTQYWKAIGTFVISEIRENANALSQHCGHDVTFPEFVKYIIKSEKGGIYRDRHFTPLYEHCRPCQIPYDFIGKFETFKEDILFLMDVMNNKYRTNITFEDFETESTESSAKSHIDRLFGMRKQLEPCTSFYNACLRTWRELQIRGILPIQENFPFSPEYTEKQMSRTDLFMAAKNALLSVQDKEYVQRQRNEAFYEAFRLLPSKDLYELKDILQADFDLFNYDSKPPIIYDRTKHDINDKQLRYFGVFP